MCTYWQKLMSTFVDFVASQKCERVIIGPPRNDVPPNRCLIPNTQVVCSWVAKQKISFAEWHSELEIEEHKTPSKRTRNETPPTGSVYGRTRSKKEYGVDSSKKDKSKSSVIVLHDALVRDTSLALTTPAVVAVRPSSVSIVEIVPFLSPDFKAKTYRRKSTAHKVKTIGPDVGRSSSELPYQPSDREMTQSEERGGDFMDTTVDSGKVVDSSMVGKETMEIGEIRDVDDHLLAPSMVGDASAAEGEVDVPPLVPEEVAGGGAAEGGVADPLLLHEGVAWVGAVGEGIINEPTTPTFDLDPSKSRKTTVVKGESSGVAFHRVNVQDFMEMFNQEGENDKSTEDFYTLSGVIVKFQRFDVPIEGLPLLEKILLKQLGFMFRCTYVNAMRKVMFQSLVAVFLNMERTPLKSLNLHKVLEWKNVLSELQSMKFVVEFFLDWLKTIAASCIIRDGEIKLVELAVKIADLEKEIAAKSTKLSSLTNQRNSIMLSSSTSGGSSSVETFGEGLLD